MEVVPAGVLLVVVASIALEVFDAASRAALCHGNFD